MDRETENTSQHIQQGAPEGSIGGQYNPEAGRKTINCDQVAWLLDIADRHISREALPAISRKREMLKLGMVYEIMEIVGCSFKDEDARRNATPSDIRHG